MSTLDKFEYKVRADEIKTLISEGEYAEAVKIADTIDWRRVKSVMMLCTISDLYKINRRYEDSRDILLLAYERHAGGRLIVYSLCELSIKLGEYVQALEYYKEYVQLAPTDIGKYILQYKLYEAQEVSLEERIEVLEALKKQEFRERWMYELAYLYHRVGLASKCIEECDDIFLLFGEGRYVLKALELKMLHEPLNENQQEKYDQMKLNGGFIISDLAADQQAIKEEAGKETEEEDDNEFSLQENILTDDTREIPVDDVDEIQVKTVDVSEYNTINLQKELAESMKSFLDANKTQQMPIEETNEALQTQIFEPVRSLEDEVAEESVSEGQAEEIEEEIVKEDKPFVLRQDTDEMQLITEEDLNGSMGLSINEEILEENPDVEDLPTEEASANSEEVFFGNTAEVNIQEVASELMEQSGAKTPFVPIEEIPLMPVASPNPTISNTGVIRTFHKPSGYDDILSQGYDGQISLVMPEEEQIEKQITGQLSIEDVMAEWERMKQDNERKRMEEIRKRVRQQTDALFADFDESTKSGLLEELEKAMVTAAIKEEKVKATMERPKVVKVADLERQAQEELEKDSDADLLESIAEELNEEPEDIADVEETESVDSLEAVEDNDTDVDGLSDEEEQEEVPFEEMSQEEVSSEGIVAETPTLEEVEQDKTKIREMSNSEREAFAPFIHHKRTRRQIVTVLDNISMVSYMGNVIITGEEKAETTALAKLLVKEVQLSDDNFSGKVAKISGTTLNKKDIGATLDKLSCGALIIEGATSMKKATVEQLLKELNQEEKGLIVLIEDTKSNINDYITKYPSFTDAFNLRVDVEALDDQTLVKYAQKYAIDQEYSIDELGVLALHTRIADMQTSDHEVTLAEIEELVDEAIYYADKKTPKHFFDILLGGRYDEEDMIILREKDFMHY